MSFAWDEMRVGASQSQDSIDHYQHLSSPGKAYDEYICQIWIESGEAIWKLLDHLDAGISGGDYRNFIQPGETHNQGSYYVCSPLRQQFVYKCMELLSRSNS